MSTERAQKSASSPSWELYSTFLSVVKEGSLSGASRVLRLAQPTVRRHVAELEEALGAVLFTRAPRGLVPTEAALAAVPYAESMAGAARALVRAVSAPATAIEGSVRLTASEIVATEVLPPILAGLLAAHPGLAIELVVSNRNEDLRQRDADVAVRMVRPREDGLVARRLGAVEVGFFATAGYLASRAAPRSARELATRHRLIAPDRDTAYLDALEAAGVPVRSSRVALRADDQIAQLAALRAGVGIGICQVPIAARDPSLHRVLPRLAFPLEVWLVTHADLRDVPRIRAVMDHLAAGLRAYLTPARG